MLLLTNVSAKQSKIMKNNELELEGGGRYPIPQEIKQIRILGLKYPT